MHRISIDQHLSTEGTVYLHAFPKTSRSTHNTSSSARSTDVTSSTNPLSPTAMDPSRSGA